jgi:hypothetical protein
MAYPTLTEVKEQLGIDSSVKDDTFLERLMTAAIAYIEGPNGADRRFNVTADTTRSFDANRNVSADRRTLTLDDDLCQITSITNGDGATVSASNYSTRPRNNPPYYALTIKYNSTSSFWTWQDTPEDAITIVGRWGYSITPPADIAEAFKGLVAYRYRRRGNSNEMDRPLMAEGGVLIMPSQVPRDIQGVLTGYRRRWLS